MAPEPAGTIGSATVARTVCKRNCPCLLRDSRPSWWAARFSGRDIASSAGKSAAVGKVVMKPNRMVRTDPSAKPQIASRPPMPNDQAVGWPSANNARLGDHAAVVQAKGSQLARRGQAPAECAVFVDFEMNAIGNRRGQ